MSTSEFQRCDECRALNEPRALFCSRCGASLCGPSHGGAARKRPKVTAASAAMGIALLIILAIAVVVLLTIVNRALDSGENVDPLAGQSGTTATISESVTDVSTDDGTDGGTGTSSGLVSTQIRPTSAKASSILEATSTIAYRATNLLDGDLATAWNEGVDGPGIGEWVRFDFSEQLVLTRIEIANGYQKDSERFAGNPRVKSLKVEYSNGAVQMVTLLDTEEFQTITPTTPQPIEWFKLIIVSVYPGAKWEDTALSEVRIYKQSD